MAEGKPWTCAESLKAIHAELQQTRPLNGCAASYYCTVASNSAWHGFEMLLQGVVDVNHVNSFLGAVYFNSIILYLYLRIDRIAENPHSPADTQGDMVNSGQLDLATSRVKQHLTFPSSVNKIKAPENIG